MPIDTAAKRRSAADVGFLPLTPGVTPNATKPLAWRQSVAWGYLGVPTGNTPIPPPATNRTAFIRRRHSRPRARKRTIP